MSPRLPMPADRIAAFCEQNRIRRFSLFGSVLRDDFGPESDVDVLVEFESGVRFGYFGLIAMEHELSEILGRKTDIYTPAWLRPWFREAVEGKTELLYESGA